MRKIFPMAWFSLTLADESKPLATVPVKLKFRMGWAESGCELEVATCAFASSYHRSALGSMHVQSQPWVEWRKVQANYCKEKMEAKL